MQLSTRELFQTHMATHDPNSDTYDSNIVVTEGEKEMEEEEMEEGEGEEGADDGSDDEEQGQEGWKTKVYSDSPGVMGQQRQRSVSNRLVKVWKLFSLIILLQAPFFGIFPLAKKSNVAFCPNKVFEIIGFSGAFSIYQYTDPVRISIYHCIVCEIR